MKIFNRKDSKKSVLIQCPYASDGTKDFCRPDKPYILDMAHPDFQKLMEEHVQQHVERQTAMFGLTVKKLACSICDWETLPFPSNNASKLKALGREEMQAQIDLDDHINGNTERVEQLTSLANSVFENEKQKAVEVAKTLESEEAQKNYLNETLRVPFEVKQKAIEKAEVYSGHLQCKRHETPGHEILVYYFRDKEEKELHEKLLHAPKVKPQNPKIKNAR